MNLTRAALVLVYMVFGALLNSVGSVNLLVVRSMGVDPRHAAWLDACKDMPIALVSLLVAPLLPRLGLKRSMLAGLAAVAFACAAMPALSSFGAIMGLYVTVGAAFALVKVSTYSAIGLVTDGERAHAGFTNVIEGLFMVGVLAGYVGFALAIDDRVPGSTNWLHVYWVFAAAVAFAFVVLARATLDETAVRAASPVPLREDLAAMWRLGASALVAVFLASAFLYVLLEQGINTWLPSFNLKVLHLPAALSIGLAVLMPLSTAVGRLTSAAVVVRVGWYAVVNACLVAIAVLLVLTVSGVGGPTGAVVTGWLDAPAAAWFFPLTGLFLAPIYPAINSAMLSALPPARHAAMTGLIVVFSALGGSTGSLITGRVFAAFDGNTAFALLLVPLAALALALAAFRRALRRAHATRDAASTASHAAGGTAAA
jgi:fucose permease